MVLCLQVVEVHHDYVEQVEQRMENTIQEYEILLEQQQAYLAQRYTVTLQQELEKQAASCRDVALVTCTTILTGLTRAILCTL